MQDPSTPAYPPARNSAMDRSHRMLALAIRHYGRNNAGFGRKILDASNGSLRKAGRDPVTLEVTDVFA